MQKYLIVFEKLINSIFDNNIVLAGTNALKLHGLKMSREAGDLDLVIFQPTNKQIEVLRILSPLQIKNEFVESSQDQRSIKFGKDGLYLDILLSDSNIPYDLLIYKFKDKEYKIQNIALNIEAKSSYSVSLSDTGIRRKFARLKDVEDIIDLKNSNFNF